MTDLDPARLEELRAWVERFATHLTNTNGWPPITGRTLGWLLVCDPPEQSAAEIGAAIQASRASLTGTLRTLTSSGLVDGSRRPGGRTIYYRTAEDAWLAVTRRRFATLVDLRDIAREGERLFPSGAPEAARVAVVADLYSWLLAEVEPLWERWDEQRRRLSGPGAGA